MATTDRDFVVKQGLKVATGVTFPDNSVQTTAFTGSVITVGSSFPVSPSNGAMHLDTNTNRIYYYYSSNENPTNNRQVMCYRFTPTLYNAYLDKLNTQVRVRAIRAF